FEIGTNEHPASSQSRKGPQYRGRLGECQSGYAVGMMRRHPLAKDIATIVLGAALLILPGLAAVDVFNPDEPREAEIAREMRASGDLVVPTFNGCPFLEKPPLFYWGVGLAAKLQFLREEAIVRLPSVLAAISLLLV